MIKCLATNPITWKNYKDHLFIDSGRSHIFRLSIADYSYIKSEYSSILSADEIEKAARFRNIEDTQRYVMGRFYLRKLLSKILGIEPQTIVFSYTPEKKPFFESQHFNISHSGDFTILALSPCAIGIDIELVKEEFDFNSLLNNCFTSEELKLINCRTDFYALWTRKEAILKATGEGLTDNLHSFDCSVDIIYRSNIFFRLFTGCFDNQYMLSFAFDITCPEYQFWDLKFDLLY